MYFVYCWGIMGPTLSDYNMQLILLSVIQLSGGHCTMFRPVRWLFLTHFWTRLKCTSFLRERGGVLKIGFSLKPNQTKLSFSKSIIRTVLIFFSKYFNNRTLQLFINCFIFLTICHFSKNECLLMLYCKQLSNFLLCVTRALKWSIYDTSYHILLNSESIRDVLYQFFY